MLSERRAPPFTFSSDVSNSALVLSLDIFILAVILFFALFNIPRVLLYIANNGFGSFQGYLLHRTTNFRMRRSFSGLTVESTENDKESLENPIPALESARSPKRPWHFPMHLSLRHPAVAFMHYRVFENYTVVQVLLMAGYTAAIFFAAFYASNLFESPRRAGWVIASQFPFVYAFATKNNVIGLLVGVGYEKLNYLHRHVGRLMVIGANVHAIGFIYRWMLAGVISKKIAEPFVCWGIVALVCFDILGFFSMQRFRTTSYNLFFGTHVVALVVVLFAACLHRPACIPYVFAGSLTYGLDHVIRAIKTRFTTATLQAIPGLGLTRVDIPSLNSGWRAGQHVRLRVLSTAMGVWGMTEVHPFTIASATNTEDGLVLMCKKAGNWTRKLYGMAEARTTDDQGHQIERRVKVLVEGPYGGVGDTMVPNYSGALIVAGGSGVTFALSAVHDLVLAGDASRTKLIEIIWSVPDPAALENLAPLFSALACMNTRARLRVSVFYTRAITRSSEGLALPPCISLTAGRPNIEKLLNEYVTSMATTGDAHGAFVGVCGPVALSKQVAYAVRTLDANSKKAIGGIQFHEEVFGW